MGVYRQGPLVEQGQYFGQGSDVIGDAYLHRRGDAEHLVDASEIVMLDVECRPGLGSALIIRKALRLWSVYVAGSRPGRRRSCPERSSRDGSP